MDSILYVTIIRRPEQVDKLLNKKTNWRTKMEALKLLSKYINQRIEFYEKQKDESADYTDKFVLIGQQKGLLEVQNLIIDVITGELK